MKIWLKHQKLLGSVNTIILSINIQDQLPAQDDFLYCDLSLQLWMQGNIFQSIKQLFGLQNFNIFPSGRTCS